MDGRPADPSGRRQATGNSSFGGRSSWKATLQGTTQDFWWQIQLEVDKAACLKATELLLQSENVKVLVVRSLLDACLGTRVYF